MKLIFAPHRLGGILCSNWGSVMLDCSGTRSALADAHRQMSCALELLDEVDAPPEIACHLDLAISRLEQAMALAGTPEVRTIASEIQSIFNFEKQPAAEGCVWPEFPSDVGMCRGGTL